MTIATVGVVGATVMAVMLAAVVEASVAVVLGGQLAAVWWSGCPRLRSVADGVRRQIEQHGDE